MLWLWYSVSRLKKVHIYQALVLVKLHIVPVSVLHFSWVFLSPSSNELQERFIQLHTQVTQPLVLMKRREGFRTWRYQKLHPELPRNIKEKSVYKQVHTASRCSLLEASCWLQEQEVQHNHKSLFPFVALISACLYDKGVMWTSQTVVPLSYNDCAILGRLSILIQVLTLLTLCVC